MYEYLKALKGRFPPTEQNEKLVKEVQARRQALASQLDKQERKLLLSLTDAHDALDGEIALNYFVAGFRLAMGIEAELGMSEPYSYAKEQEKQACEEFWKEWKEREL